MRSKTTAGFRSLYAELPAKIRQQAKIAYKLFMAKPDHPSLHFKKVSDTDPIYSARISLKYRVIGVLDKDKIIWFWIGIHTEYERQLKVM